MEKEEKLSMSLENDLFSKEKIDNIDEKMGANIMTLLESEDYLKLNREFKDMSLKLISILNPEQRKVLNEYQRLEIEITSYQNCLAYYLGCKKVIDVNK